ncbi:TonB-dependent siderophore receptor [Nostocaceae cyanobacterium CENA369]|uniref:TonB-dependent siderophore receptor n=1 Tax=Dendronalium phyllosphericum CENA369 TaxID=1725256 RepID=A0A8J7IFK3_9NOST|nr:TonB-dependent siderophore receptor [Dendronalium phyllosphericum]MBH8576567.1 TonB-dependent siderophore receptor [Dendronalium phyllosphericum CENA369]
MSSYWGVCNGCLLSFLASVCVGFGSNLVKQEPTLAQSQVNKEAMLAAGYAYASVARKTSVQSALVTNWKRKRSPYPYGEASYAERSAVKAAPKGGSQTLISEVRQLNSIERPFTDTSYLLRVNRVKNSIAQQSQLTTDVVSVTDVKVKTTNKGIELILVTASSERLQVLPKTQGNSYIVDIPNTKLQLASGESFRQEKPVAGITEVTIVNTGNNTLRLTVVGNQSPPQVELFDSVTEGLVFEVSTTASTAQQPTTTPEQNQEPIELLVTGTPNTRYQVPDTTVGTRTNRRVQDIPQSIQVVPRQSWQDQAAVNTIDALRSVGVIQAANSPTNGDVFTIRGFQTSNILRNGLKDYTAGAVSGQSQLANIERLEVLRGPASVLYGQGNPGGTINFVTKQPLSEPYFATSMTFGSYSFYQPTLDISGPLNSDKTLLYRLNASYISTESFVDFFYNQRYLIAPVLSWQISKNTKLTFEGEFRDQQQAHRTGLPAVGTVLPNRNGKIPLNVNTLDEGAINNRRSMLLGYNFEHRFSDNWSLVNAFNVRSLRYRTDTANPGSLRADQRSINRTRQDYLGPAADDEYALDSHVVGKFKTGSFRHELVAGFDLYRDIVQFDQTMRSLAPLDLFNPVYGQSPGSIVSRINQKTKNDQLGFYVQDIVSLTNNLNLVLGGRGDFVDNQVTNFLRASGNQSQSDFAFSPRVGLVYKPIPPVSLYASYSQSFSQNIGTTFEGDLFEPSRGTQYEVGVKADFFGGKLSSTLALYQLTLSNILTTDPNHLTYSIATGEQRSRGVELNVTGEILPGWNVIASYAYTDGQVTKDSNLSIIGNQLVNVPENSASLWTTYTFPKGDLQGLGFGLGLFYVGDRQGDLNNSFSVPSYLRLDAAVYYQINRLRFALNFKNLSDVRYYTARNINLVYPEDPFIVEGTVSWEF